MKYRKLIYKSLGFLSLLATISCSDYLDVNQDPNNPLANSIPPNLKLTAAQSQTYMMISGNTENFSSSIRSESLTQLGNVWMNTWAGNSNSVGSPYQDEYKCQISSSFYNSIFDYGMLNIANLHSIIAYDSDNFDNHKAIAMILKSFYMQYIVDLYGDVPYSEAFLGQANLFPVYDNDEDVYRALVQQLDDAKLMIDDSNSFDMSVGSEDAIFGGNMDSWKKFANTIKLRLLLRQSDMTDASVQSYINDELDELAGESFIDFDVTINPGYSTTSVASQNPFYARYGYSNSGTERFERKYVCASRYAADILNGITTGVVDQRRGKLFTLQGGSVVGILQGEDGDTAPDSPSFIGSAFIPIDYNVGSSMDGYLMTESEAYFILAEMAMKYPSKLSSYDPQTMFNNGITSSFNRLGVSVGSYITDIDGVSGFGWSATSNKQEAIANQKWLSLIHLNCIESYLDWVRTGYPNIPVASNNTLGRPKRLMYSVSEYTSNSANVPNLTQSQAFTQGAFWAP